MICRGGSKAAATSKMECFLIIVNGLKMFCFSSHLAQTENTVTRYEDTFSLFIGIFPSANSTGRYICNGCFFYFLFITLVIIR